MKEPEHSEHLHDLIRLMRLDDAELEQRKAYLGLDAADTALLRRFAETLQSVHPRIMDAFYAHLQQFPATRAYLQDPATVTRLRQAQEKYFADLLHGPYDHAYLRDRLQVGLAHQRIGLESRWYIGAYTKFLVSLLPELRSFVGEDTDALIRIISALLKVVFLDINLVLDTYAAADKQAIQALREHAENLICNIPLGLIVVAQDLTVLSANSFIDKHLGYRHDEIKGQNLITLFPASGLRDRAMEVLRTQQPQLGVELTLKTPRGRYVRCETSLSPIHFPGAPALLGGAQAALLIVCEDISEHDELINRTQASDNRVRAIMDSVAESVITIDEAGIIESFNPAAERLFGYPASQVIGKNIKLLMPSPYREHHDEYLQRFCSTGEKRCIGLGFREVEGLHKDGDTFPMELSISEMRLPERRLFIGIVRDITARRRDEAEMAKLSTAIEQTADSIMITDAGGIIEYVNAGFEKTTGYRREEVIGQKPSVIQSGLQSGDFYRSLWSTILAGSVFQDILINRKKNGTLYYEEKTITPLRDIHGAITHFVSTGKDITERMRTQERLQYLAHHDVLTDLPNRLLFMDRLSQAITRARRTGRLIGLLFMDLDRFKKINDTLGHPVGDQLLKELSQRLRFCLREDDTVARLSGDEFAILLPDLHAVDDILPITNKILSQYHLPFHIDGHELFITTSIGIAIHPTDGADPATLLKNADTAMYAAKHRGRGSFSFYTPDMNAMADLHLHMENELRHALDRNELHMVFQPQFALGNTPELLGVEALLRWRHPELGDIDPVQFIPLLEDTGLIIPVGEWILRSAFAQLRRWHDSDIRVPCMSINIAPRQLSDDNFVPFILACLAEYSLPAECIELEITESSMMQNEEDAIDVLRKLDATGVRIAMDDFGTGYSSLSYLQRLPVRTLKIDQSFIQQIAHDNDDSELTRAIVAMGHNLNLRVIAEGVETQAQLDYIQSHGCDGVQGYYLGRPLPAEELSQTLTKVCN